MELCEYNDVGSCDECIDNYKEQYIKIDFLTDRSFPMDENRKEKYEEKLKNRIGITELNSTINYDEQEELKILLSKLLNIDRIIVISELHSRTPLYFVDMILNILKESGFTHFLCETGDNNYDYDTEKKDYIKYLRKINKLCNDKNIKFLNIETKKSESYIGSETRTSFLVNNIWADIGKEVLTDKKNKIIYFIGDDHAGFGSSRFQTVPYILGDPVTIKLERSTENVLTLTQPTHSYYNYLTLNYK